MKSPGRPYPSFALVLSQMRLSDHRIPRQGRFSQATRALNPDTFIAFTNFSTPLAVQDIDDDEVLVKLDRALFPLRRGGDGKFRRLRLSSLVLDLAFSRRR